MDILLDSICDFATDDSKWEEAHLKTATEKVAEPGGGFNLDPRTLAMAALGAGGLAGGGALSGRLSGKQLALLGLLGAAAGGGGHELYKKLLPEDEEEEEEGLAINPSLGGGLYTGLLGGGVGAGLGATSNVFSELAGQSQASIRSVLTAPDDAEAARRLREFLARDAKLRARLGQGDAQIPANAEIQDAAKNLRSFAEQRGYDPNDPSSIRSVEEALRSGSLEIDYEGDIPEDIRGKLEAEQGTRTRMGEIESELSDRARLGQLSQRPDIQTRRMNYAITDDLATDPEQSKTYERLRKQIDELNNLRGQLPGGEMPDLQSTRAAGRLNMLTGEVPELRVGDRTFRGAKLPGAFDAISTVRNRLNAGPGFHMRRFTPRLRGVLGSAGAGAGLGALVGGLFGND